MQAKTILITGASRGLGLALAEHWAGKHTVINLSRTPAADGALRCVHYPCDLSDEKATVAAVQQIGRDFPTIDLLINNAAMLTTLPLGVMPCGARPAALSRTGADGETCVAMRATLMESGKRRCTRQVEQSRMKYSGESQRYQTSASLWAPFSQVI